MEKSKLEKGPEVRRYRRRWRFLKTGSVVLKRTPVDSNGGLTGGTKVGTGYIL